MIEAALLEHEDIVDVAVIGIRALDCIGEVPMVFVIQKVESSLQDKSKSSLVIDWRDTSG